MSHPRVSFTRQRSGGMAVAVTAVLGLMTAAVPALADTTVGQTAAPTTDTFYPGGEELVSTTYSVPAGGGTITSFHTQAASSCQILNGVGQGSHDFQALRPEGGGEYLVLGDTGIKTDPCDGQAHSYPVNIPVQSGDVLGVYTVSGWVGVLYGGGFSDQWGRPPEPSVGDTIYLPYTDPSSLGLDESATLVNAPALAAKLVADSTGVGRGHTLYEQATAIQTAVKNGQTTTACQGIATYLNTARKSGLSAATAAELTSDANALAATLGC